MTIINLTPYIENEPVQRVKLEESTRHKWVKLDSLRSSDSSGDQRSLRSDLSLC